jgi:hypothetical protein
MRSFGVALLAVLFIISALPGVASGVPLFGNEGRQACPIWSLNGTPHSPAAGDVARDRFFPFMLDGPVIPAARIDWKNGLLLDARSGRVLAAHVTSARNPLTSLTEVELRDLRGVRLDFWSDAIEASLSRLDLTHVCVLISRDAAVAAGRTLPELPASVERLVLVDRSIARAVGPSAHASTRDDPGFRSVDALRRLPRLKLLVLDRVDLSLDRLRGARDLRVLVLSRAKGELPYLSALRHLDLSSSNEITGIGACRSMVGLRNLFLQNSSVTDLSALDEHPGLEELDVRGLKVASLPAGHLPHLARVRAIGTKVSAQDEARFRRLNPQCTLLMHYLPLLRDALRGANLPVLRKPCYSTKERAVHVCRDAEKIQAFIDAIQIDETQSGGDCAGSADVLFIIYRDAEFPLRMTFHQGQSLRWSWCWPGDAVLTPSSQRALREMVARWGFPDLPGEFRSRARAAECRDARIARLLPPSVLQALLLAKSDEEAIATLVDGLPDPIERAATVLRLSGRDERAWNHLTLLDELVLELLPGFDAETLGKAAGRAAKDEAGLRGLGCWLFEWRKTTSIPAATLEGILPSVAAHALAHPRTRNRRRAILALGAQGTPTALRILETRIRTDPPVRPLAEEEVTEPTGWVVHRTLPNDLRVECGDAALAATVLARRGHAQALAVIEARLKKTDVADREILESARAILRGTSREGD